MNGTCGERNFWRRRTMKPAQGRVEASGPGRQAVVAMEMVMRTFASRTGSSIRAVEALKLLLTGVSTIKLKEIRHQTAANGDKPEFVAYVDVVGHPHAVACKMNANPRAKDLRSILENCARMLAMFRKMQQRCCSRPTFRRKRRQCARRAALGFSISKAMRALP